MTRALVALGGVRARRRMARLPALGLAGGAAALLGAAAAAAALGRLGAPAITADPASLGVFGFVVAVPIGYMAYRILYGAEDRILLRTLGVPGEAQFDARALRLLLVSAAVAVVAVLPYLLRPELPAVAGVAAVCAAWAWALSLVFTAGAARAVARGTAAWSRAGLGWDPELARVAPLLYAPLPAVFVSAYVGLLMASLPLLVVLVTPLGVAVSWMVGRRAARVAYPRFHSHTVEISFVPPAPAEGAFRARAGLSRILRPRAAAIWRRDALLQARRQPWVRRLSWIAVLGALVAVGRWGEVEAVRGGVTAVVAATLLLLAVAAIAISLQGGREAGWLDRALGLTRGDRWAGATAFTLGGLAWVAVPVALFWTLWTPLAGWPWLAYAAVLAVGVGSIVGVMGGRRG